MKRHLMIVMHAHSYEDHKRYRISIQRNERYRHYNREYLPKALELLTKDWKANGRFIAGDAYIHYHLED